MCFCALHGFFLQIPQIPQIAFLIAFFWGCICTFFCAWVLPSAHPSIHHKLFWGWTPSRPNLSAGKPTGGCAGQAPTLRVPGPAIGAGGGRALPAVPAAAVPVSSGAAPRAGDVHAPPPGARPGPDRSAGRRHQRVGCAAAFFPDLCGTPTSSSSRVDLWVDDWLRQRCPLSSTSLRGHGTS